MGPTIFVDNVVFSMRKLVGSNTKKAIMLVILRDNANGNARTTVS